ncbi:MAG: class I SAM-dependent methyltransferase [Planctomycetota bacterium]|nr:MAG: class I SAM-dependent methyltransferase [Planctomycetota bacterium]
MSLLSDLKILYHLALRPVRGRDHSERMENFYAGQAEAYDDFRKRLLQGREELYRQIDLPEGGIWVDLGGGTGANLEFIQDRVPRLRKAYVVDLARSLLQVADKRFRSLGWEHVEAVEADATEWQPTEGQVDVVTFSYSLTMIPDWFAAIDNALRMLRPGGTIGVVDFYVSRKHPSFDGAIRHSWFTRTFWPTWFALDNVFPSADHLPYLLAHTDRQWLQERRSKVPYIPFIRAPYYQYIGTKPASE